MRYLCSLVVVIYLSLIDFALFCREGTLLTASAHIITAVIGSGVLSLAWSISQLGWIAGPVVLVVFSFITYFTSTLLADCYRSPDPITGKRNYTYMDVVRANLGNNLITLDQNMVQFVFFEFHLHAMGFKTTNIWTESHLLTDESAKRVISVFFFPNCFPFLRRYEGSAVWDRSIWKSHRGHDRIHNHGFYQYGVSTQYDQMFYI